MLPRKTNGSALMMMRWKTPRPHRDTADMGDRLAEHDHMPGLVTQFGQRVVGGTGGRVLVHEVAQ